MIVIISLLVFTAITIIIYNFYKSAEQKFASSRLEKLYTKKKHERKSAISVFDIFIKLISPITKSSNPIITSYRNKIEHKINLAGNPAGLDFNMFVGVQVLSLVIFILLFLILFEKITLINLILCILIGFGLPILWINTKVKQRQKSIFRSLPDTLDLLVLSMEAGLDFSAALNKYVEKGEKSPLRDELFLVQQEIQMGKTRIDALNSLTERTKHPALSSVTSSIIQGIQLGSSLSPILKVQSEQLRIQRFQLAEKLAAEAPTKMLFPLLFFIFPTVFIILFGPVILTFLKG